MRVRKKKEFLLPRHSSLYPVNLPDEDSLPDTLFPLLSGQNKRGHGKSCGARNQQQPRRGSLQCRPNVGVHLQRLNLFEPIEQGVPSKQKTIKYNPTQKLFDRFITLLAGAHGMVEMNMLLRADPTLQAAFGREACAEQSVAPQTLDACTAENVTQMEQAMKHLVRQHSQVFRHPYQQGWQILDVDLSGGLCGKQAAFATKGYFAGAPRNRRGRQVGRVLASQYQEVVVDRLFAGNRQLGASLQELIQAAQETFSAQPGCVSCPSHPSLALASALSHACCHSFGQKLGI